MADGRDGTGRCSRQGLHGGGAPPMAFYQRGRADTHAHAAAARLRLVRGVLPPQLRGAGRADRAALRAGLAGQRRVAGAASGARGSRGAGAQPPRT
ncbi:AaceriAGR062Cp [[Ashbya] aceris (nom. inval.)]|nr:AaceriAGR062Cp [[Ashbya] aceris (nom. inval.)]